MQSTTSLGFRQDSVATTSPDSDFAELLRLLPSSLDLEASARACGALVRRREVRSAADLLRLILAYSVSDWPLSVLGMVFVLWGRGVLSKTAVRKRLQNSVLWLGKLIIAVLQARQLRLPPQAVRLRLLDATTVSKPGSCGTDWRIHLSLDVGQGCLTGIEVTDAHGGESLARFPVEADEIRVADRGYAHAKALGSVLADGGHVLVRINWQNLRLTTECGTKFPLIEWLRQSTGPTNQLREHVVCLLMPNGRVRLRLVAGPLPQEKVAAARTRAVKAAQKKKHKVDPSTLVAAGFVLLVTDLPVEEWSAVEVLNLYRVRWQVEMLIKRLKSVLVLDGLRAKDPELAQTYLLGKLLGALLQEELAGCITTCDPADWEILSRPVSPVRMMLLTKELLQQWVRGPWKLTEVMKSVSNLKRLLRDPPRKRPSQLATIQAQLHALSNC